MSKRKKITGPSDKELRELLVRHECPTPFHAVRTRFLGQIASPRLPASPMSGLAALWHGELPVFEDEASAQALLNGLISGLWNRLTVHQSKRHPFRLTRLTTPQDALSFARYTRVRQEELEGFVEGLFGDEEAMDLPQTAHEGMQHLADVRNFFEQMRRFAGDDDLLKDFDVTVKNLLELTKIAESQIQAVVISCTNSRRQQLQSMPNGFH